MNITEISINPAAPASRVPQKNASNPAPETTSTQVKQPTTQDTVSLSYSNHTVASLSQKALQVSPSRQAKVEALKQAVQGGEYRPDATKIATSLASASI